MRFACVLKPDALHILGYQRSPDFATIRPIHRLAFQCIVPAVVDVEVMLLMIGKTLGHYEIANQLGKGGMGEVYRAKDLKLGRDVAMKVLPEEFAKDTESCFFHFIGIIFRSGGRGFRGFNRLQRFG
jgi:serine/threonine protein kinase